MPVPNLPTGSGRDNLNPLLRRVIEGKLSKAKAARIIGISRKTLYLKLKNFKPSSPAPTYKKANLHREILKIASLHPEFGPKRISQILTKEGKQYSNTSVYTSLKKRNLNTNSNREIFAYDFKKPTSHANPNFPQIVKYTPDARKNIIEQEVISGKKQKEILDNYLISRKTYSKWKNNYLNATNNSKNIIESLSDKNPKGSSHPSALDSQKVNTILNTVVANPKMSSQKIASTLGFVSNHGVQNVLKRNDLNLMAQRTEYSNRVKPQIFVETPHTQNIDVNNSVFQTFTPNLAPAPPTLMDILPSKGDSKKKLLLFTGSYIFAFLLITFTTIYCYKLFFLESSGIMQSLGYVLASIALLMGTFFFIYSIKYYLTLVLVLSYTQKGENGVNNLNLRNLINWILGSGTKDQASVSPNNSNVAGLEADMDGVHLNRFPFVSVQIPFYNEKNVVRRAIEAAAGLKYPNYEIFLADDSTDDTSAIIRQYQESCLLKGETLKVVNGTGWTLTTVEVKPGVNLKHLHRTTRQGFKGAALNFALKLMDPRTEYISVFDADFVPYPDTLDLFLKYFQISEGNRQEALGNSLDTSDYSKKAVVGSQSAVVSPVAAVQGYQWHVLNKSENWITRGVRSEYAGSYVVERSGAEIYGGLKQISGSVYMIKRKPLEEVGWGTSITEDFELTLKLYEKGYKVLYTPYVQAPSECVSTIKRLVRQRMRWAEGHSFNIKKMFLRLILNPRVSVSEKFELIYLTPYYLQAFFFLIGTFAWLISETVFKVQLPFWTELWGWSLVLTNLLALPLLNGVGLFMEESDKKDYLGLFSFIALSYLLVPFQSYAAIKGFIEKEEGPWFRTPKTGRITDILTRRKFAAFISGFFPNSNTDAAELNEVKSPVLSLTSANNKFNSFNVKPSVNKYIGNLVIAGMLLLVTLGFESGQKIEVGKLTDLPVQTRVERVGDDKSVINTALDLLLPKTVIAAGNDLNHRVINSVHEFRIDLWTAVTITVTCLALAIFIQLYRKKRKLFRRVVKVGFVSFLLVSWLLTGQPVLWNSGGLRFPPKVNTVKAALPSYVDKGTYTCSASVGAAITPPLPATKTTDDIFLLFLETGAQAVTIPTPNGGVWTEAPDSPQSVGSGTTGARITVFWSRYNGTQGNPTTSAPANHVCGVIIGISGATTSGATPFDVTSGGTQTGTAPNVTVNITGDTTTGADRFVVAAVADETDNTNARFSGWTNADLANLTERFDDGDTIGNGGGLGIATGEKASSGSYTTTTVTDAVGNDFAFITLAIKPPVANDQTAYRWRNDDGSESTATWKDNENATISNVSTAQTMRLRVEAESTASILVNARLQYSTDATTCVDGTWTALDTSTTAWRVTASGNITNDDATTDQLATSAKSFTAGNIFDTQNEDTTGVTINSTQTEWEWAIQGNGASANTTYRFRITDAGTPFDSYTNCAQLTTAASNGYHQPHFRIRSGDAAGLNVDSDWAAALDTFVTMDAGKRFRIRFEVEQPDGTGVSQAYILQYRYRSSTGTWGSWASAPDRAAAGEDGPIQVLDSAQYNDGAAASTNLLAGSAETFDAGGTGEENRTTGSLLISNEHAEYEYTILIRGTWGGPLRMKDNAQLEFRMAVSTPTAFTGIYNNPRVTVNMPDYFISAATIESPGRIGPFKDTNGNLYFVIEPTFIAGTGNNEPEMLKSTDGGVNWDLVGTSGSPTTNDPEGFDVVQSGDTLYMCQQAGSAAADVVFHTFRMSDNGSPDTWGVIDEAVATPGTAPSDQGCGISRRSDGTIIVFYNIASGSNDRVAYKIRSTVPAWGAEQTLDSTASTNFLLSGTVLGASDKTHVFYKDETNDDVYYKNISSADALSARQQIEADATGSDARERSTTMPVYWDDAGSEKIMISIMDQSDSIMYSYTLTNGTLDGGGRKQVSDSAVRNNNNTTGTFSWYPTADLVVDSATDKQYAIFTPTSSGDIDFDSSNNNAGWGTDSTIVANLTNNDYLRGQIFTHSAGNGGAKVYGFWYEDDGQGDNGFSWYGQKILVNYEQSGYRFYVNADSTDVGSTLAGLNTAASMTSDGQVIRMRLLLHVTASQLSTSGETFKLQIAPKVGTCDSAFSGETYADLSPSSGTIRYADNATPTDGSALTSNANDPTHSSDTLRRQTYEESNNFTNSQAAIAVGEDGMWDFTIVDTSAADSTSYCLRVVKSNGNTLDTYTVIPEFSTVPENPYLLFGLSPILFGIVRKLKRKNKKG